MTDMVQDALMIQALEETAEHTRKIHVWVRFFGTVGVIGMAIGIVLGIVAVNAYEHAMSVANQPATPTCQSQGGTVQGC